MKCKLCPDPAIIYIVWGLYGEPGKTTVMNSANMCSKCSDELWDKCKPAVDANLMAWASGKPQ